VERLRQRAFFCFGMDVLLKLNLAETRSFFNAFFSLSPFNWHGFLSARLGFTQLIGFGLSLFANSSNQARADLLVKGLPGLLAMLLELAPTLGDYYGVRREARRTAAAAAAGSSSSSQGGGGRSAQPPQQPAVVPVAAATVASGSSSNGASKQ
jgi:lycopene beta-cyclase